MAACRAERRAVLLATPGVPPVPAEARRRVKKTEHADDGADFGSPRSVDELRADDLTRIRDPLLLVKLDRAVGLPVKDANGTSDPYVVIQLVDTLSDNSGGAAATRPSRELRELKSRVVHQTTAPMWSEVFAFRLRRKTLRTDLLQIDVYDADAGQEDEYMCSTCIPVSRFLLNDGQTDTSNWYMLSNWRETEGSDHKSDANALQKLAINDASVLVRWRRGLVMDERSVRKDVLSQFGSVLKCQCMVPARKREAIATFASAAQATAAVRAYLPGQDSMGLRTRDFQITFADCKADLDESTAAQEHAHGAVFMHTQAATSGPEADSELRRFLLYTLNAQKSRGTAMGRLTVQVISGQGLPKMDCKHRPTH